MDRRFGHRFGGWRVSQRGLDLRRGHTSGIKWIAFYGEAVPPREELAFDLSGNLPSPD